MNIQKLKKYWLEEELSAHIRGWDFSHINDRFSSEENELPWSFPERIAHYKKDTDRLLDIDTGGGEFLLSLGHPNELTSATEGWPPNAELCRNRLVPLGIDFHEVTGCGDMPFADGTFDLVINRHGSYAAGELFRILKPGGIFLTQQVGCLNDRELVEMLLPEAPLPFPDCDLAHHSAALSEAGFNILEQNESFRSIKFFDTGALVWFAKVISWEFPGFSVEKHFDKLLDIEDMIQRDGFAGGRIHRFYIAAKK